jgi:hypothetical protein
MISGSAIVRASIARFIPGVLLFLGCCLCMTASLKGITLGPVQISGFTALTLFMTLGFGASLLPMRFVLRSKAGVTGRLGMLAGFSSLIALAQEMLHGSPVRTGQLHTFLRQRHDNSAVGFSISILRRWFLARWMTARTGRASSYSQIRTVPWRSPCRPSSVRRAASA